MGRPYIFICCPDCKGKSYGKVGICDRLFKPYYQESHCKGVKHKEIFSNFESKERKIQDKKNKCYKQTGIEFFVIKKKETTEEGQIEAG